jgi:hypothetical protein
MQERVFAHPTMQNTFLEDSSDTHPRRKNKYVARMALRPEHQVSRSYSHRERLLEKHCRIVETNPK